MSRVRRKRLTTLYYAQSSPLSDSQIVWDSDNSITRLKMVNSPRFTEWYDYITHVHAEEEDHEEWKNVTSKSRRIRENVQSMCGWKIHMFDDHVLYMYRPTIDGISSKDAKFKIKFEYLRSARRWFIRIGSCFLPEIVDVSQLRRKFRKGVEKPTNSRVTNVLSEIRRLVDAYVTTQRYADEFLDNVERDYPDLRVEFDKTLEHLLIVYKAGREDVWLPEHRITNRNDSITIRMRLDKDFIAVPGCLEYTYVFNKNLPFATRRQLKRDLITRLNVFLELPLKEAFDEFMLH